MAEGPPAKFPRSAPGAGLVGVGGPGLMYTLKEYGVTVPPELVALVGIVSVGALLLAIYQFVHWGWQSTKEHLDRPGSAIQRAAAFVRPRLIPMILTTVAIAGVLLIFAAVMGVIAMRNPTEAKDKTPVGGHAQTPTAPSKPRPEYIKDISWVYDSQIPLAISATVVSTVDRLRFVIEASTDTINPNMFVSPAQTVTLEERKDLVRNIRIQIQLAFKGPIIPVHNEPNRQEIFWGNPSNGGFNTSGMNRVRLSIIGPDGTEQHYYFFAIRGQNKFTILSEKDHDWIREWRAKD